MDTVTHQKLTEFFNRKMKKIIVSRDVEFMEDKQWQWEEQGKELEIPEELKSSPRQESSTLELINNQQDMAIDDEPVRGTRSLAEIYAHSNVAIHEPAGFEEAVKSNKWCDAMKEELKMIE